jgi:hypothetical protein
MKRLLITLVLTLAASAVGATAAQAANLTGTWTTSGTNGYVDQDVVLTEHAGAISGVETTPDGTDFATVSGSESGGSFSLTAPYTDVDYTAFFHGTLSADGLAMTGTWTSTFEGQGGTFSGTRAGFTLSGKLSGVSCTDQSCAQKGPELRSMSLEIRRPLPSVRPAAHGPWWCLPVSTR